MESLVADFVQYSSVFAKILLLEGRLGSRLSLHSMMRPSPNFPYFLRA